MSARPLHVLRASFRLIETRPARGLAWAVLLGVTGFLVRAETLRPEIPAGVRLTPDLVYREVDGRRARLDLYRPEAPPPPSGYPVLVAVHGGGWRGGSKGDYGRSLLPLVADGLAIVAVDYRLSRPGSPSWPENRDDVRGALDWVRAHASTFGLDPARVALIGASAGGHLALSAAGDGPVTDGASGRSSTGVRAVIDFYGPTDLASLHASSPGAAGPVDWLIGGPPAHLPAAASDASPTRRYQAGAPAVLMLHGTEDLLVPIQQSEMLAAALADRGVPHRLVRVDGARHGFGLAAGRTDVRPLILEFLRTAWED